MSSETDWLDSLILSHKQKLAEIKQWQIPSFKQQQHLISNQQQNTYHHFQNHSSSEQITQLSPLPQPNPIISPSSSLSSSSLSSDYAILNRKVARQKNKITSLKSTLSQLTEENTSLKNQLYHLENYTQTMSIDQKKIHYDQTSFIQKEQTFLNEISALKETISSLEAKFNTVTRLDNVKTHDIELLNQKVIDMEMIMEENHKHSELTINKLKEQNEVFSNQLNEVDKLFELFNYFVKRMSSIFPHDIRADQINYLNIREFQDRLIQIENCIVDEKNKMSFHLKGIDDEHYQNVIKLNEKIEMLSKENEDLDNKLKKNTANVIGSSNEKIKKGAKSFSKKHKK